MNEDIVRVLRIVEYVGPRSWVEATVAKSIHGTKDVSEYMGGPRQGKIIRAATIGTYPEILQRADDPPQSAAGR